MRKVGLAIIGIGNWGLNYVRIFSRFPEVEVKFLIDIDEKNRKRAKEFTPDAIFLKDYRILLARKDWQAGVVATPAPTHFPIAFDLLAAGKDVLVEKPLALNQKEAGLLRQLAKRKKRKLMVGHILLYHPALRYLKGLIKRGKLGRINYIYSRRVNRNGHRNGEKSLFGLIPHDISAIIYLLDSYPERGWALGDDGEASDAIFFSLFFPKGIRVFGEAGMREEKEGVFSNSKIREMRIFAEKGVAVFDDTELEAKVRIYPTLNGRPFIPKIKLEEPLKLECRHFLDCIIKNKEPLTNGESGLSVLKVIEGIKDSLTQGGRVVAIR